MEDLTKKDMNQKEQNFLIGIQERFFLQMVVTQSKQRNRQRFNLCPTCRRYNMQITSFTVNLETDHIIVYEAFGRRFDFDMYEWKKLPEWAGKVFDNSVLKCQVGNILIFEPKEV